MTTYTCDNCGVQSADLGWWYLLERREGGGFITENEQHTVHHFHTFECLISYGNRLISSQADLDASRGMKRRTPVHPR